MTIFIFEKFITKGDTKTNLFVNLLRIVMLPRLNM